ncbi:unnamed protein product, partial [Rotaria magnacalcarata]
MSHTKKHKRHRHHSDDERDEDEHRKQHRPKPIEQPIEEPAIDPSFDWLSRRDYLTETYLIDTVMFSSYIVFICLYSSPTNIEDFWKFVQKYQLFQQRRKQPPKSTTSPDADQQQSSILNIPIVYEKKYRL